MGRFARGNCRAAPDAARISGARKDLEAVRAAEGKVAWSTFKELIDEWTAGALDETDIPDDELGALQRACHLHCAGRHLQALQDTQKPPPKRHSAYKAMLFHMEKGMLTFSMLGTTKADVATTLAAIPRQQQT